MDEKKLSEATDAARYYGMSLAEYEAHFTKILRTELRAMAQQQVFAEAYGKYPKIGVGLCVRYGDFVLLLKRKGDHQGGKWSFPGGHLEMYEEPSECAMRELKEECGEDIKVTNLRFWTVINTPYPEEGRHYVVLLYICDYKIGKPVNAEPEKHSDIGWYSWYEMPSPLIQGLEKMKAQKVVLPR